MPAFKDLPGATSGGQTTFAGLSGFGLGLREAHYAQVLRTRPALDWLEILSENLMEAPGLWDYLRELRAHYPLVLHGVGLNIASTDPLDGAYLAKLKALAAEAQPVCISDHLCWTALNGVHSHELLPVPYTKTMLAHVAERVRAVQDALNMPLVLENPAGYARFRASEMAEAEFLSSLTRQAGCLLLLDITNVHVSASNLGFDARAYIDMLGDCPVAYMHLAGHRDRDGHLLDTHDTPVAQAVWDLYRHVVAARGPTPVMLEWDANLPPLATLLGEMEKAREIAHARPLREAS